MFLEVQQIKKQYGGKEVLHQVSFQLEQHHTLSILGKSGCGKSTLLKIIAGIEIQDGGKLVLNGTDLSNMKPEHRNIVYIFQEPLLFPNLDLFENIAFGLRIRRERGDVIKNKVGEMLKSLELEGHEHKMPHQLSGGQKGRVAFGRALIIKPPLILLDEPFSSLDVEIRANMQELFKKIAAEFKLTALFVTHDLKEALLMGDRMSYMQDGLLKVYESKEDFMDDDKTGVKKEVLFWKGL